jgi:hypothetical protein
MTLKQRCLLTSGFTILSVVVVFGGKRRIFDKIVRRHTTSPPRNPSATPPAAVQLLQLSGSAGSAPKLLLTE